MSKANILRKLQAYKKNPDVFKELSNTELAELILPILNAVGTIDQMIKEGRLDGKTPQPDKEYLSLATAQKGIQEALNRYLSEADAKLGDKVDSLEKRVSERLQALKDGDDGMVTEAEIERAAQLAHDLIELPDFEQIVRTELTANPETIRDGLELLQGDERLDKSAIKGIEELENELSQRIGTVAGAGTSRNVVRQMIEEYGGGSGGSSDWGDIGGTLSDQTDLQAALDDKLDASAAFSGDYDDLTNKPTLGDLAALDNITASLVTDFDTEVANNAAVTANTAKVSNATHTGDATGATALTVVALRGTPLDSSVGSPTDGKILVYRSAGSDWVLEDKPVSSGNPAWGDITGTLSAQTDLQAALDDKQEILTEGAFVDGDKTKLDGIETGAEVNTVDTVNGATGTVVLDADDIDDTSTTHKFVTSTDLTKLSNLSGTNTGDQDLSAYQLEPSEGAFQNGDKTKLDGIEALADVTDTTNVTAAGALMDSEVTNLSAVKSFDPTDYATAAQGSLADSAVQPAEIADFETTTELNARDTANRARANHTGTQTASTISDFDTEVSNNTDVAANTAARHAAVTVSDTSEIDLTLTGQQISASIVSGSIDESKLDASVNASLDLADSAVQDLSDLSITATASELNTLDGITATTAELNYTDGVTSNIQTQLNAKEPTLTGSTITGKTEVTAEAGDFILISDASDTGALKKVDAEDFLGGSVAGDSITDLDANTTPVGTDVMVMVDDPGGTPVTEKITLETLNTFFAANILSRTTDTSTATPTPTGGANVNHYSLTALATNATFAAPSGSPAAGNRLTISIRGSSGTLGFNAIYNNSAFTVASSVIADTTIYLGYLYNAIESQWDCVAYLEVADE